MVRGVSPIPFALFVDRVLSCYLPPLRAITTLGKMRSVLLRLGRLPGLESTADLTTALIARYVAERAKNVRSNTIAGDLSYLASACSMAVEEGWLARNPFDSRRLRIRPEPPSQKRYHSVADLVRVLDHLRARAGESWESHRLYAAASTVAYTGLRRSEALRLQVEDVSLADRVLCVVARTRLKTLAAAAPVPIPPRLAEVLADWLPRTGGAWVFPNGARTGPWVGGNHGYTPLDKLKRAGRAVGVEGLTWQSLRHSWATHAEGAWMLGEAAIQRVLRHSRPLTQRGYRHADLENLRRIGERVSYRVD